MSPEPSPTFRAAGWLALASAAAIVFSIAVSQILLGASLAALLISRERLRLPAIKWPLALFLFGTLLAWVFSGHLAAGLPQIKKIYVFAELLVVFSCLRNSKWIRWLFLVWAGFAALTAVWGCVQFAGKIRQAHVLRVNFYDFYVAERIKGFTSHWNTFSAEEMFALIMLAAFLLFARAPRSWIWLKAACAFLIVLAVLLAETRGVWFATAAAGFYLLWVWKRKLLLLAPVLIVLAAVASPTAIRERVRSIVQPQKVDSNQFRIVVWRTGLRMIEAHPWLGLGPEEPHVQFQKWLPGDIRRPLPSGYYGHLHNVYLQYAAERGIPTMLVMLWLLIRIVVDFRRGLRGLPPGRDDRRFLLHGGIAVVLAVLAEGFVEYNLGDSEVLTMFLVVTACGYLALEKDIAWQPGTARE
ncbi:MAG: O-antigen ligase family protein [Bryobacteraceae bacterium]